MSYTSPDYDYGLTVIDSHTPSGVADEESLGIWFDGTSEFNVAVTWRGIDVYTVVQHASGDKRFADLVHDRNRPIGPGDDEADGRTYDIWGQPGANDYYTAINWGRGIWGDSSLTNLFSTSVGGVDDGGALSCYRHWPDPVTGNHTFTRVCRYVGANMQRVWGDDLFVYVARQTLGMDVYLVGALASLATEPTTDAVHDVWYDASTGLVLVAAGDEGLRVFEIADVDYQTVISTMVAEIDVGGSAQGVWGDGDYIYLANGDRGLDVFSLDQDDEGNWVLTHLANNYRDGFGRDVWGDSRFVYLASGTGGLDVYQFTVNGSTVLNHLEYDKREGEAFGVWANDERVYVAYGDGGQHSFTVDNNGLPTPAEHLTRTGVAYGVWGEGSTVYVANGPGGVNIYTIDQDGELVYQDTLDTDAVAYGVWSDGYCIYVAEGADGVRTYRRTAWHGETVVYDFGTIGGGPAYGVGGSYTQVYCANGEAGLTIYRPAQLHFVANDDFADDALDVWASPATKWAYLAGGESGLVVYEMEYDADEQTFALVRYGNSGIAANGVWSEGKFVFTCGGTTVAYVVQSSHGVPAVVDTGRGSTDDYDLAGNPDEGFIVVTNRKGCKVTLYGFGTQLWHPPGCARGDKLLQLWEAIEDRHNQIGRYRAEFTVTAGSRIVYIKNLVDARTGSEFVDSVGHIRFEDEDEIYEALWTIREAQTLFGHEGPDDDGNFVADYADLDDFTTTTSPLTTLVTPGGQGAKHDVEFTDPPAGYDAYLILEIPYHGSGVHAGAGYGKLRGLIYGAYRQGRDDVMSSITTLWGYGHPVQYTPATGQFSDQFTGYNYSPYFTTGGSPGFDGDYSTFAFWQGRRPPKPSSDKQWLYWGIYRKAIERMCRVFCHPETLRQYINWADVARRTLTDAVPGLADLPAVAQGSAYATLTARAGDQPAYNVNYIEHFDKGDLCVVNYALFWVLARSATVMHVGEPEGYYYDEGGGGWLDEGPGIGRVQITEGSTTVTAVDEIDFTESLSVNDYVLFWANTNGDPRPWTGGQVVSVAPTSFELNNPLAYYYDDRYLDEDDPERYPEMYLNPGTWDVRCYRSVAVFIEATEAHVFRSQREEAVWSYSDHDLDGDGETERYKTGFTRRGGDWRWPDVRVDYLGYGADHGHQDGRRPRPYSETTRSAAHLIYDVNDMYRAIQALTCEYLGDLNTRGMAWSAGCAQFTNVYGSIITPYPCGEDTDVAFGILWDEAILRPPRGTATGYMLYQGRVDEQDERETLRRVNVSRGYLTFTVPYDPYYSALSASVWVTVSAGVSGVAVVPDIRMDVSNTVPVTGPAQAGAYSQTGFTSFSPDYPQTVLLSTPPGVSWCRLIDEVVLDADPPYGENASMAIWLTGYQAIPRTMVPF